MKKSLIRIAASFIPSMLIVFASICASLFVTGAVTKMLEYLLASPAAERGAAESAYTAYEREIESEISYRAATDGASR